MTREKIEDDRVNKLAWVTISFDAPDLVYASHYYKKFKDRMRSLDQAYFAIVQCGLTKKPAVFMKVHSVAIEAIGKSAVIRNIDAQALKLNTYAILRIRFQLVDPEGGPLTGITITTGGSREATVAYFDLYLDVDDPVSVDWFITWLDWPTQMYIFVIEGRDRIAGYLQVIAPKNMKEVFMNSFIETRQFLREIALENQDFNVALKELYGQNPNLPE